MGLSKTIWANPAEYIARHAPEEPTFFFAPRVLSAAARAFIEGFPGLVTFAVKSNPDTLVLENLAAAGIRGFDVASVWEIEQVRRIAPDAVMHYNNPVRARGEISRAVELGVRSFSVDSWSELDKLAALVPGGAEVSVRFKLPIKGGIYDFGAKFGATADVATELLAAAARMGFVPSLTFHPGTQCTDPAAWHAYIQTAGQIAQAAGVAVARLNVGGGFPSHRTGADAPDLSAIFAVIDRATDAVFGGARPALVCEPGRALVAEAFSLATQIRAVRDGDHVFLSDGVYGGLAELPLLGNIDRIEVLAPSGMPRRGAVSPRVIFGPTCDSVDRLPGEIALPGDMQEGDTVLFHGMGAYSTATVTRFNGFGTYGMVTVLQHRSPT